MKKLQSYFSVLFVIALISIGLYSFFRPEQIEVSEIEKRKFEVNSNLLENNILSSEFTETFERIIADQFIGRYPIIRSKKWIDFLFTNPIFQNPDNPLVLKRIGDSPIFKIGDTDYLMSFPILYDKDIEDRIVRRAIQINELAEDYPLINFYVYKPTQIFETDFFDKDNNIQSWGKEYDKLLRESLKVPYDSFEFESFSDYPKYQYYTDHHWNHDGAQRGYEEIINLMLGEAEETLKPKDINCFDDLRFSGTYSSMSGFVTPGAPFCVYLYDLPEYELYVNFEYQSIHRDSNNYFYATIENRDAYHYSEAFDLGSGFLEVKSDSKSDRNLLIIGDSYAPSITPLLASHFNHIYLVNPIRHKQVLGYEFEYEPFLTDNNIENVLFMYVIENYFTADEWGERYKEFDVHRKDDE